MIRISRFKHKRDATPEPVDLERADLVALLKAHEVRADKDGPLWSPTEFAGGRSKAKAVAVHVLAYDLDKMTPEEFQGALERVDASGLAAVVHSTFSHTAEKPSARVVLFPSRPITPPEFERVYAAVAARLGLKPDKATLTDWARMFYLPSCPEGAPKLAGAQDGAEVNVDEALMSSMAAPANIVPAAVSTVPVAVAEESAPVEMKALRNRIRRAGKDPFVTDAIACALRGDVMPTPTGRDDTCQRVASTLSWALGDSVPFEAVLEVMRPGLQFIGDPPDDADSWEESFRKKYERGLDRWKENQERVMNERAAVMAMYGEDAHAADPEAEKSTPDKYTEDQINRWAAEQNCSPHLFTKRWIIQKDGSFYIFGKGRYLRPITAKEFRVSVQRDLARAPVDIWVTEKGKERFDEKLMLDRHATVARSVVAHLDLQRSHYDAQTQTFHEAVCPLRPLEPKAWPEIDEWIELVGGDLLRKWLAAVPRLDRQAAALYLHSPPGIGKTLLGTGVARLWTTGAPTELSAALDGFNEVLCACPLVFADEALPDDKEITAKLRRIIGSTTRNLQRKFMPTATLSGALRLLICANNDRLLDSSKELSIHDQKAVAGRFIYIKTDDRAARYLERLGGPPAVDPWVREDRIAQHVLHLRNTIDVNENARFLVEGNEHEFHDHLAVTTKFGSLICEWLVRWLADPNTLNATNTHPKILCGSGELWVNPACMASDTAWSTYVPSEKVPNSTRIAGALRNISEGVVNVDGTDFFRLKTSIVLTQQKRLLIGDSKMMEGRISRVNDKISQLRSAVVLDMNTVDG